MKDIENPWLRHQTEFFSRGNLSRPVTYTESVFGVSLYEGAVQVPVTERACQDSLEAQGEGQELQNTG